MKTHLSLLICLIYPLLAIGADTELGESVMKDLLHPGKQMYPKWAEAITPKVNELMSK